MSNSQQLTSARLTIAATLSSAALLAASMLCYPGGDRFDASGTGYRFWHNFLCDLLMTRAWNGEPNAVGPMLALLSALVIMLGGFLPLSFCCRRLPWFAKATGLMSTATALFMCVQVIFDLPIDHGAIVLVFALCSLLASVPVLRELRATESAKIPRVAGWLVFAIASVTGVFFALTEWGVLDVTPLLPSAQKILWMATITWLVLTARSRRGDAN